MRFTKLALRNLARRPGRSVLTLVGVAFALMLLVLVEGLAAGMDRALSGSESARTLIVFRQNRYCPQTSFLPERYTRRIEGLDGVESVLPVKVFLSNCRASLDVVAFQGTPVETLFATRDIEVVEGDVARFRRERQSALVGREFATRRGLEPGDRFQMGGIDVDVAGVFASSQPIEEGLVLTHLEPLQRAGAVNRLGTVTQFEVKVHDAREAERIAREIDALFAADEEPTDTRSQLAFLETATRDLREILRFGRLLAIGCVAVVLALVGNTIVLSVQERLRELGVLRTLGCKPRHLVGLLLGEALVYALGGAVLGLAGAEVLIRSAHLTLGAEGVPVAFVVTPEVVLRGLGAAIGCALLAALLPALRAARTPIVPALRT